MQSLCTNLVNMGLLAKEVLPTEPVETGGPARESNFLVSTFNFVTRLPSGVLKRLSDDDANSATNKRFEPHQSREGKQRKQKGEGKERSGKREVSKSESGTGGTNKRKGGFLSELRQDSDGHPFQVQGRRGPR